MINEVLGSGMADERWGKLPIANPSGHHENGEVSNVIEVQM